jgi:UDP-N-acetylmuramoyl-tripeptide--D-alanyl-D-alanine ligase
MKKFVREVIIWIFKVLTSFYLAKNKTEVIAITGSAGKTTTKFAIQQIIPDERVYVPKEAYNTEIGLPLAVFKMKTPENINSISAWFSIIFRMAAKTLRKAPYSSIVLEMGADKPGDIGYLTSFVKPRIGIVTTVMRVHTENFKTLEAVAEEKGELVRAVPVSGWAILNYDDPNVRKMAEKARCNIFYIGKNKKADLHYDNIRTSREGLQFELSYKGEKFDALTNLLAPQLIVSIVSAVAAGLLLGYKIETLIANLTRLQAQPGRMSILKGVNGARIIDDTYNANPESMLAALDILKVLEGRKIAVLGGMNELGEYEKPGHEIVAKKAAEVADVIVLIGQKAEDYFLPLIKKMGKEEVRQFENPYQAGDYLSKELKKGDNVLVKGSQNGVYAEEAVKKIMEDQIDADELLVRQSPFWQHEKQKMFNK